jgi:outer membrane protein OmpA-like peptidoglycan-associated protein
MDRLDSFSFWGFDMRRLLLSSLLCAAVACPSYAFAQEAPTRSVDDYLCTFAGKCGDEAAEPTKEAPETKGFSLARPGAAAEPTKEAPKTKGFSLARPGAPTTKEAPKTKGFSLSRPGAAQAATAPARAAPAATTRSAATTPAPRKATASKPMRQASASTAKVRTASASSSSMQADKRADLRLSFELGSATLTPQAMEEAKVFAQSLMAPEMASMRFVIEGHTDAQGSRQSNMDLSQRRAQAVADYLTSLGVSADRLQVKGYGSDRPLPGRSAASQDNRRVEAVLAS